MIALNELIDNVEIYRERYKFLNVENSIDDILELEKERKELQLKFEHLRAECNKNCHMLAIKKANGEDFGVIYNEIIIADKQIKEYEVVLNKLGTAINKRLSNLPNLPDKLLVDNEEFFNVNPEFIRINDFSRTLFDKLFNIKDFSKIGTSMSESDYIKSLQNVLFSEEEAYKIVNCRDNFVVLLPEFEVDNIMKVITDYLNAEKINYYIKKTIEISSSSALEIVAILNENQRFTIALKREFFTREYNIKYRNKSIDMTKFVNQINILCHA